jgi:formyl-CoA transferase
VGISLGDSLAGLYAAFGILASLWRRDRPNGDGKGNSLDVALADAVLSMMEGMLPEYGATGKVRQPSGSRISTAAPSSAYPTFDGKWIIVAANSDPLFARLAKLIGKPDLPTDPRFAGNLARVRNVEVLDEIIAQWTKKFPISEIQRQLIDADVPCTLVYSAAECAADPQFRYRCMVQEVEDDLFGRVLHPGIVPRITENPGVIRWPGPKIGAHTDEILLDFLGMSREEVADLRRQGAI